jgi:hypothetical protein
MCSATHTLLFSALIMHIRTSKHTVHYAAVSEQLVVVVVIVAIAAVVSHALPESFCCITFNS